MEADLSVCLQLAFITGRTEDSREHTIANLEAEGFGDQCPNGEDGKLIRTDKPCYVDLHMRNLQRALSMSYYDLTIDSCPAHTCSQTSNFHDCHGDMLLHEFCGALVGPTTNGIWFSLSWTAIHAWPCGFADRTLLLSKNTAHHCT